MVSSQQPLPGFGYVASASKRSVPEASNALAEPDRAFHDWYRFVLSFPPHLVRHYFSDFSLGAGQVVLDPFCGTGTTLVEARLNGLGSMGLEAHPFSRFASSVKVDWDVDIDQMRRDAETVARRALDILRDQGLDDAPRFGPSPDGAALWRLPPGREKLLIKNSISPLPLHKGLVLLESLEACRERRHFPHLRLALASTIVSTASNLRFGPEVGVGEIKSDAPVIAPWLAQVVEMAADLEQVRGSSYHESTVHLADARQADEVLAPRSIDAVITSPPYPNEKDYTRTTRLESVLLGFITSRSQLRAYKKGLVRSNTRGVYKSDEDNRWVAEMGEIQRIAQEIEQRRVDLGKTSGFERLYHRVTTLYFGGMARHLASLQGVLRPGARLAYVVGDQASYLRVMIRTGHLLAQIAERLGYEVVRIDLFRKRFATATSQELREEAVVLRWPGA